MVTHFYVVINNFCSLVQAVDVADLVGVEEDSEEVAEEAFLEGGEAVAVAADLVEVEVVDLVGGEEEEEADFEEGAVKNYDLTDKIGLFHFLHTCLWIFIKTLLIIIMYRLRWCMFLLLYKCVILINKSYLFK